MIERRERIIREIVCLKREKSVYVCVEDGRGLPSISPKRNTPPHLILSRASKVGRFWDRTHSQNLPALLSRLSLSRPLSHALTPLSHTHHFFSYCFMDANLPQMASITALKSSLTATGGLAYVAAMPGISRAWYATLDCANLSPSAVDTTTVRSPGAMNPRSRSLVSAATATPVCGQLNMPVRSAASMSSSSVASSTMPSLSDDLLVEPVRGPLIPGFAAVKAAALAAGAFGCTISGAGPTCVAVVPDEATGKAVCGAMSAAFIKDGGLEVGSARVAALDPVGVRVV